MAIGTLRTEHKTVLFSTFCQQNGNTK